MPNKSIKMNKNDPQQEETVIVKKELPYLFEKELYTNANTKILIVNDFVSTDKVYPIEGKFYSKYDVKWQLENQLNSLNYLNIFEERYRIPIEKYQEPLLESHSYGWTPSYMAKNYYNINSIQAPKIRCELTIYGEKLNSEKQTERPLFIGEKFFVG